jgi:hypothetical protein
MDYDSTTIPSGYDLARSHTPQVLDLWMNAVASCFGHGSIRIVKWILTSPDGILESNEYLHHWGKIGQQTVDWGSTRKGQNW